MPQLEHVPSTYDEVTKGSLHHGVRLRTTGEQHNFDFDFRALSQNIFKVTFTSETHPQPPYPSISEPQTKLTPEVRTASGDRCRTFEIGDVTARVDWNDAPIVSLGWTGSDETLHSDLPYRSYAVDGDGVAQ